MLEVFAWSVLVVCAIGMIGLTILGWAVLLGMAEEAARDIRRHRIERQRRTS